jgi:hypothetical protein
MGGVDRRGCRRITAAADLRPAALISNLFPTVAIRTPAIPAIPLPGTQHRNRSGTHQRGWFAACRGHSICCFAR